MPVVKYSMNFSNQRVAPDDGWSDIGMDVYLRKVVSLGEQFNHEYHPAG